MNYTVFSMSYLSFVFVIILSYVVNFCSTWYVLDETDQHAFKRALDSGIIVPYDLDITMYKNSVLQKSYKHDTKK